MKSTSVRLKHNSTAPAETSEELLSHLHMLVDEAEKILGESPAEPTSDAVTTLRARFDAAHERFSDLYESAKGTVVDRAKRTHQAIRTNPYKTAAIAAGAGLLVGLVLGRRKK